MSRTSTPGGACRLLAGLAVAALALAFAPAALALGNPTNVHVVSVGDRAVTFAWSAPANPAGVSGYRVYRNTYRAASVHSFSYTFDELRCDKTYSFGVQAYGDGPASEIVYTPPVSNVCGSAPPPAPTPPPAVAPSNTALPALSGVAMEGQTLTASSGTWSGTTPMTYSYQWLRCDSAGAACVAVTGATGSSRLATSADVGSRLRARVTAQNSVGSSSALSAPSAVVVSSTLAPTRPSNTSPPVVSGTAQQGLTLLASPGTWAGTAPMTYAYQWRRCDAAGGSCVNLLATAPSYTPTSADVGSTLRVVVTASNAAGSASATSAPTLGVTPAPVGGGGQIVRVDQTWTCTGPVNLDLVKITMRTAVDDAIHLRAGCTGRIGRVELETWTADGIKINANAPYAHDVVIEGGYIRCHDRYGSIHQDGIQFMAGVRITFRNLDVRCTTAGNAQFFVSAANGGFPTDVVCENCLLGRGAATTLRIEESLRSGARNTAICPGRYYATVFEGGAQSPVNSGNTVLSRYDPRCL